MLLKCCTHGKFVFSEISCIGDHDKVTKFHATRLRDFHNPLVSGVRWKVMHTKTNMHLKAKYDEFFKNNYFYGAPPVIAFI